MQRHCDRCGKPYEAKRPTSKYCSSSCRSRQSTNPKASVTAIPPKTDAAGLTAVTERQLDAANRLDTVLGQQALALAQRIASPHETGASVASLSKEFRAVMEAAMDGVNAVANPLDELRARRERKLAGG
jgi:hypothetical protein